MKLDYSFARTLRIALVILAALGIIVLVKSPIARAAGSISLTAVGTPYTQNNATGADDGLAVDDFTLTPGDGVPWAPASIPRAGAHDVAVDTTIRLDFELPVDIQGPFELDCRGWRDFEDYPPVYPVLNVKTITLTPRTLLPSDTECYVSIHGRILSWADSNEPLPGVYTFWFKTEESSVGPVAVDSTTPADGATGVRANTAIKIVFRDFVRAKSDAFDIHCATSGHHGFRFSQVPSHDGPTFLLEPFSNFTFNESCTVTVIAAQVFPPGMPADYVFHFTIAGATELPCLVDKPLLFSPPAGFVSEPRRVLLDWREDPCADTYRVNIRYQGGGKKAQVGRLLTESEFMTMKLERGASFQWRVKACSALGCEKSKRREFHIAE